MATVLASEDYVKDNTQHCPHCNAPIEKNEGCNKVLKELFFLLINQKENFINRLLAGDAAQISVGYVVLNLMPKIPTLISMLLEVCLFCY